MVIVVTTSTVKPESFEAFESAFKATVETVFKGRGAWRSTEFAAAADKTSVILISRWQSAEAYKALVASPEYMTALSQLSHILESAPVVTIYETRFEVEEAPPAPVAKPAAVVAKHAAVPAPAAEPAESAKD